MKLRFVASLGALVLSLTLAACGSGGGSNNQSQSPDGAVVADAPTSPAPEIRSGSFTCTVVDTSTPEALEPFGFSGGTEYTKVGGPVCIGDESKVPQSRSCLNPPGDYATYTFTGKLDRSKPGCSQPLWVCDDGGVGNWSAKESPSTPARLLRGFSCNPYTHQ